MQTAHDFSDLMGLYAPIAGVVFALVLLALLIVTLRDRAGRAGEPSRRSEAPRLESAYVVVLVIVSALLVWRTFVTLDREDAPIIGAAAAAEPAVPITVTAVRWNWRFDYGGGVTVVGRDLDHPPTLVVPAHRRVRFALTSGDVVHSFWLPAARAKYDAVPGRVNRFTVVFDPKVDYSGSRCSEFCGTFHDRMVFGVRVLSATDFARWLHDQRAQATTPGSAS